ncbi:LAGLIDADG family homing endonuclease [Streptomyces sp. GESEQ-4]|uniref:LAGLIDADG family homing endonuclease n=1 Tax=Streptomyces sp. GESEQ-4 TaxID=2812655 RepID=UPI001B3431E5|nr:LAGLIDADG family homing endonuclease [Streptomyces sp. GESEQ-4]
MADCEPSAQRFMDLRVPEYAYMFGFLQADGHLQQGVGQKGKLTVELNARDIDILHNFQKLTPYYSSVTERTRSTNFTETHRSATWSLCSLEARTLLNELGLPYGRKSKTISPPHVEFSGRDYLRGVIDADGSVGYTSKGLPFISLTTASTAIGTYLCQYAEEVTGAVRNIKRNARDDIYNILYTKESAQKLAAGLYYPGCLSLERKWAAADSLASWVRPEGMQRRPPRIQWTPEMDRILLAAPTIADAATLGYSNSPCQVRRWKLLHGLVPLPD